MALPNLYNICSTLIASQYVKDNILAIISSICGSEDIQLSLQGTLYQLATQPQSRYIINASGEQLDGIGYIIGVSRPDGYSDEMYRDLLIIQAVSVRSSGTIEQVHNAIASMITPIGSGDAPEIRIREKYPQSIYVVIFELFENLPTNITEAIQAACAAPITVTVSSTNGSQNPFYFGGSTESYVLELNGVPLLVNSSDNIVITQSSLIVGDNIGFGYSEFAGIMG